MHDSVSDDLEKATHYIDQRQELVEDVSALFKDTRNVICEARRELPLGP